MKNVSSLNSVLLEGVIHETPLFTDNGEGYCVFTIASNKVYIRGGKLEKVVNYFCIEAEGNLAEACKEKAKKGVGARVVGCLRQKGGSVITEAEHIEFRPTRSD